MAEGKTKAVNKKKLDLYITTPRGLKFVEKADMIIMRCVDGDLGVLPGHEPVSTVLGDGILRVYNDGIEKKFALFGGVVEIKDRAVDIYSTIAQRPEEIDLERAQRDRQEAEDSIIERTEDAHFNSLHVVMRRSLVRIEVSTHLEESEYSNEEVEVDQD